MTPRCLSAGALALVLTACPSSNTPIPVKPVPVAAPEATILPEEVRFEDLRQLTFGGENAEAYWSFDGKELIFQSRPVGEGCDQIFRLPIDNPKAIKRVSTGEGVTTCSYFMPGNDTIIYASTHLGGATCPPRPDHSQGYVWALYDTYDIFQAKADGSDLKRLTDTPGYDAEATVCAKDGSIVFTSVRDGDIDLYRMDKDGKNVVRLTNTPGYDGGAFFNADCSKIVWRASRPTGKSLEDFKGLLAKHLVRPTQLELYVANADGSEARQITYLGTASFAPYWFPTADSRTPGRIIFSSNYPDPRGREFDLWAVNADGTDLERITYAPGFDGFPMFSPDGKTLAFSSNRATAEGGQDTNVFLVSWKGEPGKLTPTPADRVQEDIAWLAAPERTGRGIGTPGLEAAGAYIEKRYEALGLKKAGGSYRQAFEVITGTEVAPSTTITLDGKQLADGLFMPLAGSSSTEAQGDIVFAEWGIAAEGVRDDYAKLQVKDKLVLVRRFAPDDLGAEDKRRYSDLRYKAFIARQKGARGLIVVDAPPGKGAPEEAPFPGLDTFSPSHSGIPMVIVKRAVGQPLIDKLVQKKKATGTLKVTLTHKMTPAFNVVGRLPATGTATEGAIVIGAHYDHLGMGGHGSLAPEVNAPHLGADDNASGTAALLEVARVLAGISKRTRDVWFVAFSAEEIGVLGSAHFVEHLPEGLPKDGMLAMLNMDMVGRLRDNRLIALGGGTANEWPELVGAACAKARVLCDTDGGGYGPSDQTSFYAVDVPVLHFFTGAHEDYHKPSDTSDRINAAGAAQVAAIVAGVADGLMQRSARLSFNRVASPPPAGDLRGYGASLGTIPDYAGPKNGQTGVLLSGVRPGGAAEIAGMKKGDILVKLGAFDVADVRELMFVLRASKPGEKVKAVVIRDGKKLELDVEFQKSAHEPGPSQR